MALLQFPTTPIPFSGKSPQKYRGRRVKRISPKRPKAPPGLSIDQRKDIVIKAKADIHYPVLLSGFEARRLLQSLPQYLLTEAPDWHRIVGGEVRMYPSFREIEALRGAAIRFIKHLEPVEHALWIKPPSAEAQQA